MCFSYAKLDDIYGFAYAIMKLQQEGEFLMHIEELLSLHHSEMNENDHYIWNYIQQHRKESEHMSIDMLAKNCHVSRSTILRFTRRIGLQGYAEFKVLLAMDHPSDCTQSSGLQQVYHTYADYMAEMKNKDYSRIIQYIAQSKHAYVYGTGSIQNNVASEIKRSFLIVDKLFFTITSANESYIFTDVIDHEDVIIMISFSGENQHLLEFTRKLKAKSVPIISITASRNNTLSHLADEALYVDVPDMANPLGPRYQGLVNYFILVDFILVKYIDEYNRRMHNATGRAD